MGWSHQNKPPLGWPIDPGSGLVPEAGFWPFLEGSGNKVFDLSNGNTGTLVDGVSWEANKLVTNGSNYVNLGNKASIKFEGALSLTVIAWIIPSQVAASSGGMIFCKQSSVTSPYNGFAMRQRYTGLRTYLRDSDSDLDWYISSSTLAIGKLSQVALTLTPTVGQMYIDGVPVGGAEDVSSIASVVSSINVNLVLGRCSDYASSYFAGGYYSYCVFNRALSASEIALLYREPFCMFMAPTKVAVIVGFQSVGGIEYIETGRAVSCAASIVPTDTQQMTDTEKAVSMSASIILTDTQQMLETNRAVTFEANTTKTYAAAWFGVNSSHLDSYCEQEDGTHLTDALNQANRWYSSVDHTHWFKLNLDQSVSITQFRSRSNQVGGDPTKVTIYVSETDGDWGAAVATDIATWQDSDAWVIYDSIDKQGQWIYVQVTETEGTNNTTLNWGDGPIFDVYGEYTNTITDTHQMADTGKAVSFAASIVPTDAQQMLDTAKDVSVAASVTESDAQQMVETSLGITVAASLNVVDAKQMIDTNLAVSFAASLTVTDAKTYLELLCSVLIAASVTESDISAMIDTNKTLSFAASVGLETEIYTGASIPWLFGFVLLRQHTS